MKIFLIDPEGLNKGLNLGLGLLAGSLKKAGYTAQIIDLNNNRFNICQRLNAIKSEDLIGISVKSFTVTTAVRIAQMIGREDLFCGGPHITIDGSNFIKTNPFFSFGIRGEGEIVLPELITAIETKKQRSITGVLYREDSQVDKSVLTRFIPELDCLPDPDYSCFDSINGKIVDYPVITSRGCPHGCIYCCVGKISGKKMRFRSIERVISEIERAIKDFDSESFSVLDDNFTFDVNRAKEFCHLLMNKRLNISWSCPNGIRADRLDDELALLMAKSGCKHVSVGIESLDENVFSEIKKGESLAKIRMSINCLKKHSIRTNGFFLIGLPGDSLKRSLSSLKEASTLGLSSAHWNLFVPYPGTQAWDWVAKNGFMRRNWKGSGHFGPHARPVFDTPEFSYTDMMHIYNRANIVCHNYSAFFDSNRRLYFSLVRIIRNILKYDFIHIWSHLYYILSNIGKVRSLLSKQRN